MGLADTFTQIVDSLPDDWTDLEIDVRIFDERDPLVSGPLFNPDGRTVVTGDPATGMRFYREAIALGQQMLTRDPARADTPTSSPSCSQARAVPSSSETGASTNSAPNVRTTRSKPAGSVTDAGSARTTSSHRSGA